MQIEFDSYWELLALHKSLMAVKFDEKSSLPEAQGSPYTGSLAFKVIELLISECNKNDAHHDAEGWVKWQKADLKRSEAQFMLSRIKESEWWKSADEGQRRTHIRNFMAPFILSEEDVNYVVNNC